MCPHACQLPHVNCPVVWLLHVGRLARLHASALCASQPCHRRAPPAAAACPQAIAALDDLASVPGSLELVQGHHSLAHVLAMVVLNEGHRKWLDGDMPAELRLRALELVGTSGWQAADT